LLTAERCDPATSEWDDYFAELPEMLQKCSMRNVSPMRSSSKYPPAEPEALQLLAPQKGLIATGEKQKQPQLQQRRLGTIRLRNRDCEYLSR
jgi:hypothetical protein